MKRTLKRAERTVLNSPGLFFCGLWLLVVSAMIFPQVGRTPEPTPTTVPHIVFVLSWFSFTWAIGYWAGTKSNIGFNLVPERLFLGYPGTILYLVWMGVLSIPMIEQVGTIPNPSPLTLAGAFGSVLWFAITLALGFYGGSKSNQRFHILTRA